MNRVRHVAASLAERGLVGTLRATAKFAKYHTWDKYEFVYFAARMTDKVSEFPTPASIVIREATPLDVPRIQREVFPFLVGNLEYERRYFQSIGESSSVRCYLAEVSGSIVHYSWVNLNARASVLATLPVGALSDNDVYIGPVFTRPDAPGAIYPSVLTRVLRDLRALKKDRLLLMVDGRVSALPRFYRRIGFQQTGRPPGPPLVRWLRRGGPRQAG